MRHALAEVASTFALSTKLMRVGVGVDVGVGVGLVGVGVVRMWRGPLGEWVR